MSRTDPAIEFTENLSGMFQPPAVERHPLEIPDMKAVFGNASGIKDYGTTPVADMGPGMQQTLAPVISPKNPIDLFSAANHAEETLRSKPEGMKPPAQGALGELFGGGAKLAREALDTLDQTADEAMKPALTMQNNFPVMRPGFGSGIF